MDLLDWAESQSHHPEMFVRVENPEPLELRPLQSEVIENISAAFRAGNKNVMVCGPCGFGKTEVAVYMLQKTKDNGKRGTFICDRISLVSNTSQRLDKYGLSHGVRQSSHPRFAPSEQIQVCTIQTLKSRGFIKSELSMHDEAHELQKGARDMLLRREGYSVGLSATPMTKGLGKYFDCVITAATTNQLIELGLLVPIEAYDYKRADMSGVGLTKAGEYIEKEGEGRCLKIVGDVVKTYQEHGEGKPFICFAFSTAHADELERQFLSAGIIAKCYHYKKEEEENAQTIREFKPGSHIQGLISIRSLTRGFDATHIGVVICARPLRKAIHEFLQMIGRGARTHEGKDKCILLDHTGNWTEFFGEVQYYFENGVTELDDGKPKEGKPVDKKEKKPVKCPKCSHVFAGGDFCPACGFELPKRAAPEHEDGELVKVTDAMLPPKKPELTTEQKRILFAELKFIGAMRNWKPGRDAAVFRSIAGTWPNAYKGEQPIPPSFETLKQVDEEYAKWKKQNARSHFMKHLGVRKFSAKPPVRSKVRQPTLF